MMRCVIYVNEEKYGESIVMLGQVFTPDIDLMLQLNYDCHVSVKRIEDGLELCEVRYTKKGKTKTIAKPVKELTRKNSTKERKHSYYERNKEKWAPGGKYCKGEPRKGGAKSSSTSPKDAEPHSSQARKLLCPACSGAIMHPESAKSFNGELYHRICLEKPSKRYSDTVKHVSIHGERKTSLHMLDNDSLKRKAEDAMKYGETQ